MRQSFYAISAIPVGGYVIPILKPYNRTKDEIPSRAMRFVFSFSDEEKGYAEALGKHVENTPPAGTFSRLFLVLAGPMANLLFAFACTFSFFYYSSFKEKPGLPITSVRAGSPAEKAGIKKGDLIAKINGNVVFSHLDLAKKVQALNGKPGEFLIERRVPGLEERTKIPITLTPDNNDRVPPWYRIGIFTNYWLPVRDIDFVFSVSVYNILDVFSMILGHYLFGQKVEGSENAPLIQGAFESIVGIGEGAFMHGASGLSSMFTVLNIIILLINLIPLPSLDGGEALFLVIDTLFPGSVSPQLKAILARCVMALCFLLLLAGLFKDVINLWT